MRTILHRGLTLAAASVLVIAAAACGGGSSGTPGVTASTVVVGTHQPLTGPASPGYSKISVATKAYFDHVNAHGGVHGRKITYRVMDDGYNPANTQQVVRKLVLSDRVFAVLNGLGTPTHTGVLDFLKTNRVPDLFVASGSRSWNQPAKYPTTFGFNPDYTVEGKILATYIKGNLPNRKVCFFGQADDFGRDALAGVRQVLGAGTIATRQSYVPTNTDVAPQLSTLKAAGCQVVVSATVPGFTALAVATAARLGFRPQWVVSNVGGDKTTLAARLGAAGAPLLDGLVSAGYLPAVDEPANPWTVQFRKIAEEYAPDLEFDGNVIYGMSVGYLFVQALQAAGRDLTRTSIVDAVTANGFTGPGMVPLRFSAGDHSGYGGLRVNRVTGGKQAYVGPVYVTDDRSGPVREYTEAAPTPPANAIPVG
ncbi:MAG: branched-chain amino acid transport system substrate-binding protein [Actinomycetota bacterium]|jgi:ABC-type branched-subunit amino acid transport system substrate-binding protein|nr:branched-chain amino acid transport system substrate-binding protein [Actinomycetota bacterium]